MSLLEPVPPASRRPPSRVPMLVAALLLGVGGFAAWRWLAPPPAPAAAVAPATRPAQSAGKPHPPGTGSLEVTSQPAGAEVRVDGRSVGTTPVQVGHLDGGSHAVRIDKPGFAPIARDVHVIPGRVSSVAVTLSEPPAALVVTSDVPGASVFVDREFVGRTPLRLASLARGTHHLNVSAEGQPPWSRTVDLASGTNTFEVRLTERPPLAAAVNVTHRHGFGSCQGRLVASPEGLSYQTDHKDAFVVPLDRIERLELDYLDRTLTLRVRGGRRYDFKGDPDQLLRFDEAVEQALSPRG